MRKINKILIFILGIILFINNYVYGSFADYTDEDAEKDTQVLIREHEKNFDSTKSENNYLKSLSVSAGILSPNFDKQTVEYILKIKSNINEINIIANAEDERAKISGIGRININDISECKIEVSAESGTARTYFIKIIKEAEEVVNVTQSVINKEINEEKILTENVLPQNRLNINNVVENEEEKYGEVKDSGLNTEEKIEYKTYIIGGLALFILVFFFAIIIKTNNKLTR